MAYEMRVHPGPWNDIWGLLWVRVKPDPLAGTATVRVTVHREDGQLWAHVEGANGGVEVSTVAPAASDEPGGQPWT
jgi:hypothetical protein